VSKGIQYPDGYDDLFADAVVEIRGEERKKRTTFVRLWVVSSLFSLVFFSFTVWRSSTCNGLDGVELSTMLVCFSCVGLSCFGAMSAFADVVRSDSKLASLLVAMGFLVSAMLAFGALSFVASDGIVCGVAWIPSDGVLS